MRHLLMLSLLFIVAGCTHVADDMTKTANTNNDQSENQTKQTKNADAVASDEKDTTEFKNVTIKTGTDAEVKIIPSESTFDPDEMQTPPPPTFIRLDNAAELVGAWDASGEMASYEEINFNPDGTFLAFLYGKLMHDGTWTFDNGSVTLKFNKKDTEVYVDAVFEEGQLILETENFNQLILAPIN